MTWPTSATNTTNLDDDTDSPAAARVDLFDGLQKLNQIIAHVPAFAQTLIDDTDAATARATLGLGTLATQSGTFSGTHSGSSSGTNTGDQTSVSGSAATVTAAAQPAITSVGASLVWGTGAANFGTLSKRKTADESVSSSTTLQNDDHLTFAIAANEEWRGSFSISCGAGLATTGVNVALTVPSGATMEFFGSIVNTSTLNSCLAGRTATSGGVMLSFQPASGASGVMECSFWVLNGATPGNVTLQWSQATSSATPLTFRKGSSMEATRLA